jgi:chitinase
VTLSSATGGILEDDRAVGTINDNDPIPALSVSNVTSAEGNSGTSYAKFTISLSRPKSEAITVDFETDNGTAIAPADYRSKSGTKVFLPGQTTKTVSVAIVADSTQESAETFFLNLVDPDGATVADGQGLGTITDDDGPVTISINDISVIEASGTNTKTAIFTVSLSRAPSEPVTVSYATADGTATAPSDYTAKSGTLTFSSDTLTRSLGVITIGDNTLEPDETFVVNLSNPVNATIGDGQGQCTLVNND